jgi:tripartite-type tricarboxylate transporter receptor subunit TctC
MALRWLPRLLALLFAFAGTPAHAQDYPSKSLRLIVPVAPGGGTDILGRLIARKLSEIYGQQVVVDNRPGAGTVIGSDMLAKSPPDGYTLSVQINALAANHTLYAKLPYDTLKDFTPVKLIASTPNVLVVHPSLPVKSVAELIAYAKVRPGQLNYASSGNGSGQHLFMAMFASMAGLQLTHVPYRGSGQATTDLLAGTVPMAMPGTAGMVAHIRSGRLRALAVSGSARSPQLPDVPTLVEAGLPGYSAYVWLGLLAPKGTPAPIIERLHRELVATLGTPEVKSYFNGAGIEVVGSTPAEFEAYFREERDRWARVVKESGAKIE